MFIFPFCDLTSLPFNLGITHIGIVTENRSKEDKCHLFVHNIVGGQVMEGCLFNWKIIGHYRYGA